MRLEQPNQKFPTINAYCNGPNNSMPIADHWFRTGFYELPVPHQNFHYGHGTVFVVRFLLDIGNLLLKLETVEF